MFLNYLTSAVLLLISSSLLAEDWSAKFTVAEEAASEALIPTVVTAEYFIIGICGIIAIFIYMVAGVRHAEGDIMGSLLSFCAATLIAIAPFLSI